MKIERHWIGATGLALIALVINFGVYYYFQSNTNSSSYVLNGKKLERFFLVSQTTSPRYLIIETESDFDKHFHPAALNGLMAIKPDFSKEWVIVVDDAETDIATDIAFLRCEINQRTLRFVTRITRGDKQTYTIHPQAAFIVSLIDQRINQTIERIEWADESGKILANHIRKL